MYPINGLTQWFPLSSVRAERPGTTEAVKRIDTQETHNGHTIDTQ